MNNLERTTLETETGGAEARLLLRSNTLVDTGRWLRRSYLWICVTEADVVLMAVARRRLVQRVPLADCQGSHYCHTTGELVIESPNELHISRVAMSPTDGIRVLDVIRATK